jgi:hypothetical protein
VSGARIAFDLDYALRVFVGDYSGRVEPSEMSIANALFDIAESDLLSEHSRTFLRSLALTFCDTEARWQNTLSRRGKGRSVSFDQYRDQLVADGRVADFVAAQVGEGHKMEAAVAAAMQAFGISRSAVFEARKRDKALSPMMREVSRAVEPEG